MDNYSIGNRIQKNLAPSLDMTDSIINYGSYKIFRTADGRQIINENVDSLLNNSALLPCYKLDIKTSLCIHRACLIH
ncbi:putative conjugative transfer TraG domain protein [Orientia tsutsugamushi str. UT76]|nr:putative conjugative transfer TraG domain protein [Orientia tsutsugamushi str. UT76]